MNKLAIVVVNRNCLGFTKDCLSDLGRQDSKDFHVYLVDNNSEEIGTRSFYSSLNDIDVEINDSNMPLTHIWNKYAKETPEPYICFLNNDVRIPSNFVSDTVTVFEKEPRVGIVNHPTNHPKYLTASVGQLAYEISEAPYRQGWDFSFRKEAYNEIPRQILFFCGDDYLCLKAYEAGWRGAYATSSPIIHFQGQTKTVRRDSGRDILEYKKLGLDHNLDICHNYSRIKPVPGMNIFEVRS